MTTTALINIGFTAASLLISAGISYWQQYEEKVRAARLESQRMAEVNKILASGWGSVIDAANSGDVASINKIEEARSNAQAAINIQLEKRNKLAEERKKLNDDLYDKTRELAPRLADREKLLSPTAGRQTSRLLVEVSDLQSKLKQVDDQQLAASRELIKAREAYRLLDREERNNQDFKILAERRKDLEEKIKQTREEYSKEIADKEFQSTIERLNLERQAAKERVQFEKSAITEQYNLLSANSSDQESKSIQQLSKYKVALLEAADAEAQRRSDLEQKQMQMKKAIEDYAFKMARERIRLEKELGGYQKQMEQYKNNMTDIRLQKEVNAARQREALLGINYQPANAEQQQAFINASQDPSVRMDHRKLYAYLQMIPKDQLGVTSLDEPLVAFQKLYSYLLQLKVRKGITGLEGVAEWQGLPPTIVPALLKEAERRFGTEMWSTPRNPSDVKVPNLNIDIPGYTARLESADKILLQATRDLQESQRMNDTQRVQQILNQVKDPSTLTDVRNSYASELDRGRTQVRNLTKVIGQLGNTSSFLSQKLEEAQQSARAAIRGATRELVAQGKVTESDVNYFANLITKNEGKFDQRAQLFYSKLDDTTQKYLAAIIEGMANATNQIKNNAPTAQKVDQLNQFQESLRGSFPADAGARQQPIREMFNRILDAKNPIDEMSSLEDRINRIKSQASLMIESLRAQFPEISKEFNKELTAMGENWVKNMTQVEVTLEPVRDKLRAALDPITTLFKEWQKEIKNTHAMVASLAQSVSSELSNAMSSAVTGVLEGTTTVKDAFANMFRNIAKSFIDMAMQMIAKALILKVLGIFLPGLGLSTPETTAAPVLANGYPALAAANGGAFSANGIIPFASGGIVSRPTMFRFADGGAMRSGIMGEAGPEAILPLRRGADGRLGVMAGGAGGGGINVVVNVDATGSKVEGDNTQASQLGRAISAAVQSELVKQKRPGGLLA
ncbi:MAG: hypothetical protein EBU08_03045 [Micrococcales bacterium]|nr:hypothetical protein [Micrococcales bacterium]